MIENDLVDGLRAAFWLLKVEIGRLLKLGYTVDEVNEIMSEVILEIRNEPAK